MKGLQMKKCSRYLAVFVGLSAATTAYAQDDDAIDLVAASDLKWETTQEGVAFATLDGNRFKESYQAMVRLPAGLVSPVHIKSADMYGLIVSGEMVHLAQADIGGSETILKAEAAGAPAEAAAVGARAAESLLSQGADEIIRSLLG